MKKTLSLVLALILLFALCACGGSKAPAASASDMPAQLPASPSDVQPTEAPTPEPTEAPAPAYDAELPIQVMVLNGTTGFGMAKLIDDAANGTAALNYTFSVETDASNVTAALVNGSCDIAALPTNAASALYNKTEGGVQCLALNTLGVLYVVTSEEDVNAFADLSGKTVYAPAQNPSFIVSALAGAAEVDCTVDTSYAQPADLLAAVSSGEVTLAVLPEPMVTIALASNENLRVADDLTAVWDTVYPVGSLVQGCVVVRSEFAAEHPAEIAQFLQEYGASIAFLSEDADAASEMIVNAGIFAKAPVAKKAIPNCNICFITGAEMQEAMDGYLNIMFEVAPQSVGGKVPADDFYCILN